MKLRMATLTLVIWILGIAAVLPGVQRDYLERHDVHAIMEKVLRQHVETQQMSASVLKRSLQVYLDQFDPDRLYFLESEIAQYQDPSDQMVKQMLVAYQKNDFSIFGELNALTQKAIFRSRDYRENINNQISELVEESLEEGSLTKGLPKDKKGEKLPFATEESELIQRQRDDCIRFIAGQRLRVGKAALEKYEDRLFKLYESRRRSDEHEYLFLSSDEQELSEKDREHYFVLHILKAITASLDAHTAFFDSGEAYDMRVRLEKGFQGIGVVLQESIEGVVITRLIEGGPAEKGGEVLPNDRLVEVDGRSIIDDSFRTVLDLIRGEEGSSLVLGIKRLIKGDDGIENEEFIRVKLQRERVIVNEDRVDIEHREVEGGIVGVIRLHSFYEGDEGINSEADVRRALKDLRREGNLMGLILDLRSNTGGFLIQAVKVAGLFITNGVVVVSKYGDGSERVFRDIDGYTYYGGPLVVLTSRASASAAEIVAQALQDYGTAIVVGDEQTYGKGSLQHQTITDESSTSFFKVTVGRFYTVSGRSTQIRGVEADIIVPSAFHKEAIGERFLDYPLSSNKIHPFFSDGLDDVDESVRYWYRRYYLPSLQHRTTRWEHYLPQLRARSLERLVNNKDFQEFVDETGDAYQASIISAKEDQEDEVAKDLQLEEALYILQDMVEIRLNGQGFADNPVLRASKEAQIGTP